MTRTQFSAIAIALSTLFAGSAMAADNGPVTRAQVKAELAASVASGNVITNESGELMNQAFPHNYAAQPASTVTRAQVKAELAEAIQNGEMIVNESGTTHRQVFAVNYGDHRNVASKSREQVVAELAEAQAAGLLDRHIEA